MAYVTGTATSHTDLWSKLISFLTTNSTLVAASQNWSIVWTHASGQTKGVVLRGPGLAGQDQVYIGLRLVERAAADEYEIQMNGMTGIIGTATEITGHVNVTPYLVRMFVDSGSQTYWFVANGRRFMTVVKISTVFEAMYGGLILPYSLPDQYSYPLFIGGSAGETDQPGLTSWRSTSNYHHHFPYGFYDADLVFHAGSAWLLSPQGDWLNCNVVGDTSDVTIAPRRFFTGFDIRENSDNTHFGYEQIRLRLRPAFGGDFLLTPFTIVQSTPSDQTYGVLDGAYHVTGFTNSSQNLITVNSVDHLTVQDAFRTGVGDYWAMALN